MGEPIKLATIDEILNKKEGRFRVCGRVVAKFISQEKAFGSITLDDETETIRAKFFSDQLYLLNKIEIGDFVEASGKLNEFQEEIQIIVDSAVVFENMNWELLRKLQIIKNADKTKEVFSAIKMGDRELSVLISKFGDSVVGEIKILLERGEIYEIAPKEYAIVE